MPEVQRDFFIFSISEYGAAFMILKLLSTNQLFYQVQQVILSNSYFLRMITLLPCFQLLILQFKIQQQNFMFLSRFSLIHSSFFVRYNYYYMPASIFSNIKHSFKPFSLSSITKSKYFYNYSKSSTVVSSFSFISLVSILERNSIASCNFQLTLFILPMLYSFSSTFVGLSVSYFFTGLQLSDLILDIDPDCTDLTIIFLNFFIPLSNVFRFIPWYTKFLQAFQSNFSLKIYFLNSNIKTEYASSIMLESPLNRDSINMQCTTSTSKQFIKQEYTYALQEFLEKFINDFKAFLSFNFSELLNISILFAMFDQLTLSANFIKQFVIFIVLNQSLWQSMQVIKGKTTQKLTVDEIIIFQATFRRLLSMFVIAILEISVPVNSRKEGVIWLQTSNKQMFSGFIFCLFGQFLVSSRSISAKSDQSLPYLLRLLKASPLFLIY